MNQYKLYSSLIDTAPQNILDLGCGKDQPMKSLFPDSAYYGYDSSIHWANNIDLYFPYGCYDLVIAAEILEHLESPLHAIENIKKCLLKDGKVLISIPNDYNILRRLKILFGGTIDVNAFSHGDKHLHYPTLKQTESLVCENFHILHKTYWSGNFKLIPDCVAMFLARLCPTLFARMVIYVCTSR